MNSNEYLDMLSAKYDASDYRISQLLELHKTTISKHRRHGVGFDETTSIKVAHLLDIPPAIVLADMQAERSKDDVARDIWKSLSDALKRGSIALPALLFFVIMSAETPAIDRPEQPDQAADNMHYAKLLLLVLVMLYRFPTLYRLRQ